MMKQRPLLSDEDLIRLFKLKYGMSVEKMCFVPVGEVAYSFVIESASARYFTKIYETNNLTNKGIHNLETAMFLVFNLSNKHGINQVIKPIKNKEGKFRTICEDFSIVLMHYIGGRAVEEKESKTKSYLYKMGKLLAEIHNTTNNKKSIESKCFEINLAFKDDLLLSISEITKKTTNNNNFVKLKKLTIPHLNHIMSSLNYLEKLAAKLNIKTTQNWVMCHTDPNLHNVIIDEKNQINLVDWDGIELAPFERDIWFFMNDQNFESLIEGYRGVRNIKSINEDFIIFLFYHRVLDDLTDWIYRILFEEASEEQIESDFYGLEEDVWPLLPNMKETEKSMRYNCKKWKED